MNDLMGKLVEDRITKFQGLVTGAAQYITGCDQYLVQPECKKDGTYVDGKWFDDSRLKVLDDSVTKMDVNKEKPGACGEAPIK